jgi:hypothetical protein
MGNKEIMVANSYSSAVAGKSMEPDIERVPDDNDVEKEWARAWP